MKNKKNESKDKNNNSTLKWFVEVSILTFILSLLFSYISTNGVSNLNLVAAIIILIVVIFVGILFDIVAVAVTIANIDEFHAKATKKVKGSKTSINLITNAPRVSNFCADVIGDICGVLSGAIGALIAFKIGESFNLPINIQSIISALVASLTVGGKALGKNIANKYSTPIVHRVGIILNKFTKKG